MAKEPINQMADLTDMDAIRAQIKQQETAQEAPKESPIKIDFNMVPTVAKKEEETAIAPATSGTNVSETTKLIGEAHKQAIIATIQNKEEVKERVLDQAEKSIDNELKSLEQENIQRLQQTTYDANKEACSNYGIDANVPLWQINLMKIGSAIWFVLYWIVATIIICPINVFCKGLKYFIKQAWLVGLIGVLLYLLIAVGIPALIAWVH